MRALRYVTADVFTGRQFGGNPLAVVLDARGLTGDEMLAVTREFNYSESTFVLPPERGGAARVRIFTPGGEVPFAGHPTVGTAHVLFAAGLLRADGDETTIVLEEGVGDVPVRVRFGPGAAPGVPGLAGREPAYAELTAAAAPVERDAPDAALLAEALSLDPADLLGGDYAPRVASCGLPFTLVPVRDRAAVARARVRPDAWERAYAGPGWGRGASEGAMVVAMDAAADAAAGGADARARVFVPELAVPEDPATGSACAALGGYLARRTPRLDGALRWTVAQGVEMGRPSLLHVTAEKRAGEVAAVRVGGESVVACVGTLYLRDGTPGATAGGRP
jgi:trans-2,3-dihydro-3-hydroxyanthranilate isomerase